MLVVTFVYLRHVVVLHLFFVYTRIFENFMTHSSTFINNFCACICILKMKKVYRVSLILSVCVDLYFTLLSSVHMNIFWKVSCASKLCRNLELHTKLNHLLCSF